MDGLAEYQGITGLLGNATAPAGSTFLTTLGESAIAAKQDLNGLVPPPEAFEGDMYDRAAQDAVAAQVTAGDAASNTLLGMVAGDTLASQDLITDTDNRHALLGAGWTNGTGAAAVLTTATSPAQDSPAAALRSAELTRTVFTELGENPQAWRELIPKDSEVSNAITQLGAARIESFAVSAEDDTAVLGEFTRDPDGRWIAGLVMGEGPGDAGTGGGQGIDFIKFVASGTDPAASSAGAPTPLNGDQDMQLLRAAAHVASVDGIAAAIAPGADPGGMGVREALTEAGYLRGALDQGQYEALIDQRLGEADAGNALAKDQAFGSRLGQRVLSELVVGAIPGGGVAKQLFNVGFDEFALRASAPDNAAVVDAVDNYARTSSEARATADNHLLATAAVRADPTLATRYPEAFDHNGTLLPIEQIDGVSRDALAQAAADPFQREGSPLPPVPDWDGGRADMRVGYDEYEHNGYQPSADAPPSSFDDATRERILNGRRTS